MHLPWCGTPTDHTSTYLQPVLALCGIIRCNDDHRHVHLPSYTQHSTCTYLSYICTHSAISIIYTQCCLEVTCQSTSNDDQVHLTTINSICTVPTIISGICLHRCPVRSPDPATIERWLCCRDAKQYELALFRLGEAGHCRQVWVPYAVKKVQQYTTSKNSFLHI